MFSRLEVKCRGHSEVDKISRVSRNLYLVERFKKNLIAIKNHVIGHCCKDSQGQRSKIKVIARPNALSRRRLHFDGVALWASRLTCLLNIQDGGQETKVEITLPVV